MPKGPLAMFLIHECRGVAAKGVEVRESVFATREPHFLLEILGLKKGARV